MLARWIVPLLLASASAPQPLEARLQGVYKRRFAVAVYGEEGRTRQTVEDVIEIVRHDEGTIYFRARLHFDNGHLCGLYGLARLERGAFVYRDVDDENGCTLTLGTNGRDLTLDDRTTPEGASTCSAFCGARGSFAGYRIPLAKRREIRYMDRIKASRQYAEAVEEQAKAR